MKRWPSIRRSTGASTIAFASPERECSLRCARCPVKSRRFSREKTNFSGMVLKNTAFAAISHGWNSYRWGPRFLNWGAAPQLYGQSPHLYVFHPWKIRAQTLYCALSRGCLADPVYVGPCTCKRNKAFKTDLCAPGGHGALCPWRKPGVPLPLSGKL